MWSSGCAILIIPKLGALKVSNASERNSPLPQHPCPLACSLLPQEIDMCIYFCKQESKRGSSPPWPFQVIQVFFTLFSGF